jgi:hypothetical protein
VDVPYIRLGKGLPTEAAQRQALRDAGVPADALAEAYVDRAKLRPGEQSAWAYMLGAVREDGGEPDRVCIARPAILAPTEQQARERLAELTAQGGVLFVASTGRTYRWHPDAAEGIAFAAEVRADERALVLTKARAGLKALGRQAFTAEQWKEARRLWKDPAVTVADAEKRSGIGMRTLYRKLGPKGTAPFGRVKGRRK